MSDTDFDDIRINFSDVEASNRPDPVPAGKYVVAITDGEIKACGPNSKNAGKPYINWEFTIQEGGYANQKMWTNAMLFEPALFTMKNILEAVGMGEAQLKISELVPELTGSKLLVKAIVKPAEGNYDASNEIKSYYKYDEASAAKAAGGIAGSLLP